MKGKRSITNSIEKFKRIRYELEKDMLYVDYYDAEAGQDFRWSIIFLERAMRGLEARRAIQKLMATQVPNK